MWDVADVTEWPEENRDARGVREKSWLRAPDGSLWLFKRPRANRQTEPAVEWFVLELARFAAIDCAEAIVAVDMAGGEQRGSLVRRFMDPQAAQLISGQQVLHGADGGYESEKHELDTLDRARQALHTLGSSALQIEAFLRMLALDAWVGNADRHQGNWSLLETRPGDRRLSPIYDPATCLGVELLDDHPLLDLARGSDARLAKYAHRCGSGWGDGTRMLKMPEVIDQFQRWPEWPTVARELLPRFRRTLETFVPVLLQQVPEDWWSVARRDLASILLRKRLEALEGTLAIEGET